MGPREPLLTAGGVLAGAQVLGGDAYDGRTVDMWSCGCSLYIMLVGNYPFRSTADNHLSHVQRMRAMFPRIMAGDYAPIPHVRRSAPRTSAGIYPLLGLD